MIILGHVMLTTYRYITWFSLHSQGQKVFTHLLTVHTFLKTLLLQMRVHESFMEAYTLRKGLQEMCPRDGEGFSSGTLENKHYL